MSKTKRKLDESLSTCFQILLINNEFHKSESLVLAKIIMAAQQFQILNIFLMMLNDTNYSHANRDQITYTIESILQIFNPQEYMIQTQNIWLIPLFLSLIQVTYVLYHFILYERSKINKQSIQKYFQAQNSVAKAISCFVNYSLLLSNHVLVIPLTRILIYQINTSSVIVGIAAVFAYILFVIVQIFAFLLFFEQITIQVRPLQKMKTSFSDVYGMILQHGIVILYEVQLNSDTKISITVICLVIYYLFQINNVLTSYASQKNNQLMLYIFSFNIGYIIIMLTKSPIDSFTPSLILILFPLLGQLLQKQQRLLYEDTLLTNNLTLAQCQYKISKLVDFQTDWPNVNQICLQIYLQSHRKSCLSSGCLCIKKDADTQIRQFIRFQLIDFMVLLSQTKQAYRSFSYYLHYISAIQIIGLSSKALQQSRNLMNEISLSTIKSMKERSKSLQSSSQTQKDEAVTKPIQYKVPKMNLIEKSKLEILYSSINQGMSKAFEKETQNDGLQGAIQLFLQQEEKKKSQISMILQILQDKRKFMISLSQNKILNPSSLLRDMKTISQQILLFLDQLQSEYQAFPSQKLQSALAFIYGEILNNYSKAFTISQVNTVSDERLLQLHRTMIIDLFSNKLNYMMILVDAHFKMEIKQKSQNMQRFFGYSYETFSKFNDATLFLPLGFGNVHQRLIQSFLETGESKFYQQINNNYCITNDGYMKQVEFFYDIDLSDTENLSIITFFQNTNSLEESYIFVNTNRSIAGVSKELFKAIGFSKENIKLLSPIFLRKLKIQAILPEFDQILIQDQLYDFTTILNFIKPSEINVSETRQAHWTTQNTAMFSCTVDIQKNIIEDTAYYLIKIKNIRAGNTYHETEQESVSIQIKQLENMEFSQLDISQENPHNLPNVLYHRNSTRNIEEDYQIKVEQFDENNYNIVSPKDTSLIDNSRQQLYFQSVMRNQSNSLSFQQSFSKKEVQYGHGEEAELKKQIEQQLKQQENQEQNIVDAEDIGSQVSQLAGFRRSKFYRKYELYDKLVDSGEQVEGLKLSIIFYSHLLFVILMYTLIILIQSQSDLKRFLQEIDLLSIKPELYGPAQNYVSSKIAYQTYFFNIYYYNYNATLLIPYEQYSGYMALQSFGTMRANYLNLTINPLMQQFFNGQQLDVYMMTGLMSIYTMKLSLREAIDQFINSLFTSNTVDPLAVFSGGTNQPYVVYTIKNIFLLSIQFDQLTSIILDYSLQRATTVSTRWYLTMFPFQLAAIALQLTAIYYFYQYKLRIKFFLQQIVQQDQKQMIQESINLRIVNEIVEKEPDIIYNYKFDIDRKEQLITKKMYTNADFDKIRSKDYYQRQPPMLAGVFCNLILFGSFLSYSLVQDQFMQQYINSYRPSIEFYVQMSNISVSVGSLYTSRELLYHTTLGTLFFLTIDTRPEQISFYEGQMQVVQQFLTGMSDMPSASILSTSTFRNEFNNLKVRDICSYLTPYELSLAKIHCLSFYNGVASLGLQLTLNAIVNDLNTEFSINQFSSRPSFPLQTSELSVIIYSVMTQMRSYYKADLITVTNTLITQFIITSTLYLILNALMLFLTIFYITEYYWIEFKEIKYSIFLANQYSLFIDANFERRLRQFTIQNQLI